MASKSPEVLTPEQRLLFTTLPDDLSSQEITRYYTLQPEDKYFVRQHRGQANKLGVALQLCALRFQGRMLMQITTISEPVVVYMAEQLNLPATTFAQYGTRRSTLYDHLTAICQQYDYRACDKNDVMPLIRYLLPFAMENEEALPLVDQAMIWIRREKLIAPTLLTTEKLVWHIQRIARWRVHHRMTHNLSTPQKETLQNLLVIDADKGGQTPLFWLRIPAKKPSSASMYHLLVRIEFLKELQLPLQSDNVFPARRRQLAERGRRYRPQALSNLKNSAEQYALLVAYLHILHQELIDKLLDMFDRWLGDLMRKGRNKQRYHLHQNVIQLNRDLNTLKQAMAAFLNAKKQAIDPFKAVFTVVKEEVLVETVASATTYTRPSDMDFRDLLENTFVRRRKAMLSMMRTLSFQSTHNTHSGLEALDHVLHLFDEHKKRVQARETIIGNEVFVAPLRTEH
jgi:hypothetical protein